MKAMQGYMRGLRLMVSAGVATAAISSAYAQVQSPPAQPSPSTAPPVFNREVEPNVPIGSLDDYFSVADKGLAKPDADGFIKRWMVLEPIARPNPSNTVFTESYVRANLTRSLFDGQFAKLPRAGSTQTIDGDRLLWHALDARPFDVKLFNFAQALGKPKYGVLFQVATVVIAPRELQNVRLAVGSNSASMWWVNGEEAALLANDRRMVMDDAVSPRLTLKKGRNVIWGAVINGPGLSDFCVRFIDDTGKPLTDLDVTVS